MLLIGILEILIGALALLLPEAFYYLTEAWKHRDDAEPSGLYLFLVRCTGAVFCVLGVLNVIRFL